jgi:hypothetical protein
VSLILLAALSASTPCAGIADARRALEELRTAEALEILSGIRDDLRCDAPTRARAWMLSARGWFAFGEDPSARYSVGQAVELSPLIRAEGLVPAVLGDLIEHERKRRVGDKLRPSDRTGNLVDLSKALPIQVSVPTGREPIVELRVGGRWSTAKPRLVPGTSGKVFGVAVPRDLLDLDSVTYRFTFGEITLGPYQKRLARVAASTPKKRGVPPWVWLGVGGGVTAAVVAGVLLYPASSGCVTDPGTACMQLRIRP